MQEAALPLPSRRTLTAAGLAVLLAGCAHPPAPSSPGQAPAGESRADALRRLGFRQTEDGWTFDLTGKLLFESGSDQLDAESQVIIERLARGLHEVGVARLRVEGHTDDVGTVAYNQALSERRAQTVARALAGAGLQNAKIETVGLGKSSPVVDNRSPDSRLQNRRVAVIVPAQ